jgi:hypothetical protein
MADRDEADTGGEAAGPSELPVRLTRSIGLAYDKREDRIRVYINTQTEEERELWLTRRLVLPLVMNVMRFARDESTWTKGAPKEAATSLFDAERRMSLAMTQNRMSSLPKDRIAPATTGRGEDAKAAPDRPQPTLVTGIRFRKAEGDKQLMLLVTDAEQLAIPLLRSELLRLLTMLSGAVEKGGWVALPASRKTGTDAGA